MDNGGVECPPWPWTLGHSPRLHSRLRPLPLVSPRSSWPPTAPIHWTPRCCARVAWTARSSSRCPTAARSASSSRCVYVCNYVSVEGGCRASRGTSYYRRVRGGLAGGGGLSWQRTPEEAPHLSGVEGRGTGGRGGGAAAVMGLRFTPAETPQLPQILRQSLAAEALLAAYTTFKEDSSTLYVIVCEI